MNGRSDLFDLSECPIGAELIWRCAARNRIRCGNCPNAQDDDSGNREQRSETSQQSTAFDPFHRLILHLQADQTNGIS